MISSYILFTRANYRLLAYGIILMILSCPGQTFFISLFVDDFRDYFYVTDGEVGLIFAAATFLSALVLPYVGQQIDQIALTTYTISIGLLLFIACLAIGLAPAVGAGLCIGVFLLRLGGQGLMVHTAMTATTRAFPVDSGKAIAIVSLFYSASLIFVPSLVVLAQRQIGWRSTWIATAVIVLAGTLAALRLLAPGRTGVTAVTGAAPDGRDQSSRPRLALMLLACPSMLAVSFIFTGLLFHQAKLASEKGWSLEWLAGCFSIFAVSQAMTSFLAGPVIDRFRAVRVLPIFLAPLAIGLCLIAVFDSIWIAPAYMALLGISAAIDLKLGTILWRDLFGPAQLGYVRSRFEAIRIIVTGGAPPFVGTLLDFGIPLTRQAAGYACYLLCVSGLSILLIRSATRRS